MNSSNIDTVVAFLSAYYILITIIVIVLIVYHLIFLISIPKSLRRIAKALEDIAYKDEIKDSIILSKFENEV